MREKNNLKTKQHHATPKSQGFSCWSSLSRIRGIITMEKDLFILRQVGNCSGVPTLRRFYLQNLLSVKFVKKEGGGGSEHLKSGYGHLTWHWSNCWLALSESHRLIPTWSTAGSGSGNAAASNAQADHLASSQETSSSPSTFLPKSSIFFIIDWAVNVIIKGGLTDEIVSPPAPPPNAHSSH